MARKYHVVFETIASKCRPGQEVVRLALHDVSDAHELRVRRERREIGVDRRRLQIDPADDADDERVRVGEGEEPARFLERLPRLHRDARVDAGRGHLAQGVRWQKVAHERRHRAVDPAVLDGVVSPEVLVGVDADHAAGSTEKMQPRKHENTKNTKKTDHRP